MAYDFVVIGANGLQGRIVSRDLIEKGYRVLLCDKSYPGGRLAQYLRNFRRIDLRDSERTASVLRRADAEVVVNCAEGDFNLEVQKFCLKLGSHYLDLGSDVPMTKAQFALHRAFERKKLCAMTGCGSVPGIGNVMLAHAAEKMDQVEYVESGFAWKPNMRVFVAPFSMVSIIEELTDWPIMFERGKFRRFRPQSGTHVRTFRWIGRQRVFLARHAEPYTYYQYLKNKRVETVKFYAGFPRHSDEVIKSLVDLTFHNPDPVLFEGKAIQPDFFLAQFLKRVPLPKGYKEWENLWVEIIGKSNRKKKIILMECIVPPLKGWEEAGCNIDTGFPAAIIAEMIKYGDIAKHGSFAPEAIVPEKPFFKALKKHKFIFYENGEKLRV